MINAVMKTLGFRKQGGGGCGCSKSVSLTGGWKHSSRASLASSKRLSMRISKNSKRGTKRRKRRNAKRRGTKRRGTKRRGTKRRGRKRRRN